MMLMLLDREGWTYVIKDKVAIMRVAVTKEGLLPNLNDGSAVN